jgi:hypothetical protein
MGVTQRPDPTLLTVASALDGALVAFLRARRAAAPTGKWEAPVEAWNLTNLVVQTLDGLCLMARTDMALIPPATQCARAALEHTVRAIWMRFEAWLASEAGTTSAREKH